MRPVKTAIFLIFMAMAIMLAVNGAWAEDVQGTARDAGTAGTAPQKVELTEGGSMILGTSTPFSAADLADPNIADAKVLNPQQLYLTGKSAGTTNLILRDKNNMAFAVYEIDVKPDVDKLKDKLHEMLPDETGINIVPAADNVALSGTVSSTEHLEQALKIAETYSPKKVLNFLQVGGVQQVMLDIRVSEMSRTLMRRLGVNFDFLSQTGQNLGISLLGQLVQLPQNGWPKNPLLVSPSVSAIYQFFSNESTWTFFIDALKEQGVVKVLAEPTLVTLSGQTANFLAGGEYPIPVPQGLGTVAIDYKKFGVELNFTPTVLGNGKISMVVAPSVSDLDYSNAIQFNGFVVPGLTERKVSTTVELADGQSFALAGLLRDDVRESINKFPLLGEIPILGALFRSTQFQKDESELVVIVTPHLVKPLDISKQVLPGENFVPPGELEFYLLANPDSVKSKKSPDPGKTTTLEGNFGQLVP